MLLLSRLPHFLMINLIFLTSSQDFCQMLLLLPLYIMHHLANIPKTVHFVFDSGLLPLVVGLVMLSYSPAYKKIKFRHKTVWSLNQQDTLFASFVLGWVIMNGAGHASYLIDTVR